MNNKIIKIIGFLVFFLTCYSISSSAEAAVAYCLNTTSDGKYTYITYLTYDNSTGQTAENACYQFFAPSCWYCNYKPGEMLQMKSIHSLGNFIMGAPQNTEYHHFSVLNIWCTEGNKPYGNQCIPRFQCGGGCAGGQSCLSGVCVGSLEPTLVANQLCIARESVPPVVHQDNTYVDNHAYLDNEDGTVTQYLNDRAYSGSPSLLMWKQCAQGRTGNDCLTNRDPTYMTWGEAQTSCGNDTTGGYSDWRLPNTSEMKAILEYPYAWDPYTDETFFPNYDAFQPLPIQLYYSRIGMNRVFWTSEDASNSNFSPISPGSNCCDKFNYSFFHTYYFDDTWGIFTHNSSYGKTLYKWTTFGLSPEMDKYFTNHLTRCIRDVNLCAPVECPNGATDNPSCSVCPIGKKMCNSQCVLNADECLTCLNGATDNPSCSVCPIGKKMCNSQCVLNADECLTCLNGATNYSTCTVCPASKVLCNNQCVIGNACPTNGQCGPAHIGNGGTVTIPPPVSSLCAYTSVAPVVSTDDDSHNWTCEGDTGGGNADCFTNICPAGKVFQNGMCVIYLPEPLVCSNPNFPICKNAVCASTPVCQSSEQVDIQNTETFKIASRLTPNIVNIGEKCELKWDLLGSVGNVTCDVYRKDGTQYLDQDSNISNGFQVNSGFEYQISCKNNTTQETVIASKYLNCLINPIVKEI